jgi:hypothetical protein
MAHLTSEGGGQEFDLSGASRCRANANAVTEENPISMS